MVQVINNFGNITGWNQIEVVLFGRKLIGISKISYKDSVEVESVYGAGPYPIGTGQGNYSAEFSMTILKEEMDALVATLPDGTRLHDLPPTDVSVLTIRNGAVTKDVVRNVKITGRGIEANQNDKSLYEEPTCHCSHIEWNVQ